MSFIKTLAKYQMASKYSTLSHKLPAGANIGGISKEQEYSRNSLSAS